MQGASSVNHSTQISPRRYLPHPPPINLVFQPTTVRTTSPKFYHRDRQHHLSKITTPDDDNDSSLDGRTPRSLSKFDGHSRRQHAPLTSQWSVFAAATTATATGWRVATRPAPTVQMSHVRQGIPSVRAPDSTHSNTHRRETSRLPIPRMHEAIQPIGRIDEALENTQ